MLPISRASIDRRARWQALIARHAEALHTHGPIVAMNVFKIHGIDPDEVSLCRSIMAGRRLPQDGVAYAASMRDVALGTRMRPRSGARRAS